jgi:hypothetical protein
MQPKTPDHRQPPTTQPPIIDQALATDLLDLAKTLQTRENQWPAMDEETIPRAAIQECVAILHDAATQLAQPFTNSTNPNQPQ